MLNRHKSKIILAIETSCDDTGIAVIKNGKVLSNVVLSTAKQHIKYGGIVPEIAARGHEQDLLPALMSAINQAKIKLSDLTSIAYTAEPGLPGSLHIGKVFAKSLASLLKVPLIPVDHMMGHVFSFGINRPKVIKFPLLALVVSGGHTSIYLFRSIKDYYVLNKTADDAVGETLDKVGRMLGLPYPGGVSIDKIYNSKSATIKLIKHYPPEQSFSFSGIKTHMLNLINKFKAKGLLIDQKALASSLLKWMIDEIVIKLNFYIRKCKVKTLVVGGGVSANKALAMALSILPIKLLIPEKKYTGDNAAMIGMYAYLLDK
ncbi:tRNA N6-adenosine threonylcarbamoyltransferase [Bacilli bacterium]|nr:tRNA N6-adenosine threonylcarbamoyltransferase [Bacilli bacterium]